MSAGAPLSRVLVVQAHDASREHLVSSLSRLGFWALGAADGERALYLCTEHAFQAIIVAVDLPGISAADLCLELRRRSRTPILTISGAGADKAAELLDAGADDHVDYPFDPIELRARIRALTRRHTGELASERQVRLGEVVVNIAGDTATSDGGRPLKPMEATTLAVLCEVSGSLVSRAALRERVTANHGHVSWDDLQQTVQSLEEWLTDAGAPPLRTVAELGYILGP